MSPPHSPPPPPPFDDFEFFNPALHALLPSPPPLPPSSDLFSASETTDFLGFLDNIAWDFQVDSPNHAPYSPTHYSMHPGSPAEQHMMIYAMSGRDDAHPETGKQAADVKNEPHPDASSAPASTSPPPAAEDASSSAARKPLLSTPQKRLNHILSEQKRRNAIRDGYVQLTTLLAPAGAPPGVGMPTRGRPKGSGSRGRGTKGKSGILFRAKEYIQWLEEGNLALSQEVMRVEAAAGIRS